MVNAQLNQHICALHHQGLVTMYRSSLISKAWATLKVKFFLWLVFRPRIWTADKHIGHKAAGKQLTPMHYVTRRMKLDYILFLYAYIQISKQISLLQNMSLQMLHHRGLVIRLSSPGRNTMRR